MVKAVRIYKIRNKCSVNVKPYFGPRFVRVIFVAAAFWQKINVAFFNLVLFSVTKNDTRTVSAKIKRRKLSIKTSKPNYLDFLIVARVTIHKRGKLFINKFNGGAIYNYFRGTLHNSRRSITHVHNRIRT